MIQNFVQPGLLWHLASIVCFCGAVTLNRYLAPYIAKELILLGRCVCAAFLLLPFVNKDKVFFMWPLQVLRGILTASTMYCTYSAYRLIPTATMALFGVVTPLLGALFSVIFLKERMRTLSLYALLFGVLGVSIVYWDKSSASMTMTYLYAPLSCLLCSLSTVCGRILLKKGATTDSLLLYNVVVPLALAVVLCVQGVCLSVKVFDYWHWLFLVGFLGGFAQYCFIQMMRNIRLSLSASLDYIKPLILIPTGVFFFHDVPQQSFYWGACLVLVSAILSWVSVVREKDPA